MLPSVINVFWFCEVVSFKIDTLVLYEFKIVNPLIFNDVINVALSFTSNSFNFENPLTFNFENIVILSDVILFA